MQRNIEELASELIRLSRKERLEIIKFLLFPDNHSAGFGDVGSAWEKEISDRVHAVEDGTAEGTEYGTALRQTENRFSYLPLLTQREAIDFMAFIKQRYARYHAVPKNKSSSIEEEPFIGMWKNRTDMTDSTAWVRNLRQREWG